MLKTFSKKILRNPWWSCPRRRSRLWSSNLDLGTCSQWSEWWWVLNYSIKDHIWVMVKFKYQRSHLSDGEIQASKITSEWWWVNINDFEWLWRRVSWYRMLKFINLPTPLPNVNSKEKGINGSGILFCFLSENKILTRSLSWWPIINLSVSLSFR